jgi:hypothetical protein
MAGLRTRPESTPSVRKTGKLLSRNPRLRVNAVTPRTDKIAEYGNSRIDPRCLTGNLARSDLRRRDEDPNLGARIAAADLAAAAVMPLPVTLIVRYSPSGRAGDTGSPPRSPSESLARSMVMRTEP